MELEQLEALVVQRGVALIPDVPGIRERKEEVIKAVVHIIFGERLSGRGYNANVQDVSAGKCGICPFVLRLWIGIPGNEAKDDRELSEGVCAGGGGDSAEPRGSEEVPDGKGREIARRFGA